MAEGGGAAWYPGGAGMYRLAPTAPPAETDTGAQDLTLPPSYEEALAAPALSPEGAGASDKAREAGQLSPGLTRPQVGFVPPPSAGDVGGGGDTGTAPVVPGADPESGTAPVHTDSAPGDPPPSYDSLYGKIKNAAEESDGCCDFITKVIVLPCGIIIVLLLCLAVALLMFGAPLALTVVGSYYFSDCPLEPGLPVWMILSGVSIVLYESYCFCGKDKTSVHVLAVLFFLGWYIAGAVVIFRNWEPRYQPSAPPDQHYCVYPLFMTSFVCIIIATILAVFLFLYVCEG